MKRLLIIVVLLLTSFFEGQALAANDVVFVGGWKATVYETKEFGIAVGANITIPLPDSIFKLLLVGYSADHVYEQFKARGLEKKHPVIIAYSWGGMAVRRMLAEHPEIEPEKLILVASPVRGWAGCPIFDIEDRDDVPTYVVAGIDDKTVSADNALYLPADLVSDSLVVKGVGHEEYFANKRVVETVTAWAKAPALPIVLSAR